ncbi:MAG: hypothetical protein QOJ00_752 [Actinomycetota bacterium]
MRYEDAISAETPEGVVLELTLAGIGSRFTAAAIDGLIQTLIVLAIFLGVAISGGSGVAFAVGTILAFATYFVYDIAFETRASGRTPGKRWTGLRVVKVDGRPVDFRASAVRNLLRVVDSFPGFYLVAIIAVFLSKRNQRLGDLAARTLVVRDKRGEAQSVPFNASQELDADVATWDVSGVTASDVAAVRQFLERRGALQPDARARLATSLARRLYPAVVGPPERLAPEWFLEQLLAAKAARNS